MPKFPLLTTGVLTFWQTAERDQGEVFVPQPTAEAAYLLLCASFSGRASEGVGVSDVKVGCEDGGVVLKRECWRLRLIALQEGLFRRSRWCRGSSMEQVYMQLAKNQEPTHKLKPGWHVLRNRAEEEESTATGEGSFRTGPYSIIGAPYNDDGGAF